MADEISRALAAYALGAAPAGETTDLDAKRLVMDSLGAALGAVDHPAAVAGRRYAAGFPMDDGALVWGTDFRTNPEVASLVNGALLRAYDYNDLHRGRVNGGHSSDMTVGVVAVGDVCHSSGREVLTALEIAFEIAFAMMDTFPFRQLGWDYGNITGVAAACAMGRLMGLTATEIEHAVAITVVSHVVMNTAESNELDAGGELTMWKRFNGSDAIRQAAYACGLAAAGVEGAVRPYQGPMGVLELMFSQCGVELDDLGPTLALADMRAPSRMHEVTMKRWPVGARAQAAVHASLEVRAQCGAGSLDQIESVLVATDEAVADHLVRAEAWNPQTRTQADHSLPYVVAVALVDGAVTSASFSDERIADPEVRDLLARVKVEPADDLAEGLAGGYPSRVAVELADGTRHEALGRRVPGHIDNPLTREHLEQKLRPGAVAVLGADAVGPLAAAVWDLDQLDDIRTFTDRLAGPVPIRGGPR